MGFWDTLTGRSKPVAAEPGRAVRAARGRDHAARPSASFRPTGAGRGLLPGAEGPAFAHDAGATSSSCSTTTTTRTSSVSTDQYGFTWLLCPPATTSAALVTDLHAVNTSLEDPGVRPAAAVLAGVVRRPDAAGALGAGLPLQAGHVLPVRPGRRAAARQPARDPGPRPARDDLPIEPDALPAGWRSGAPPASEAARRRPYGAVEASVAARSCPAGRASAAGRPWPSARCRGRPRCS